MAISHLYLYTTAQLSATQLRWICTTIEEQLWATGYFCSQHLTLKSSVRWSVHDNNSLVRLWLSVWLKTGESQNGIAGEPDKTL